MNNFMLAWLDNMWFVGLMGMLLTLGYWILSLDSYTDKLIDEQEFLLITAVTSFVFLLFTALVCIPSPERLQAVDDIFNKTQVIVKENQDETPKVDIIRSDLDIGNVNTLFHSTTP